MTSEEIRNVTFEQARKGYRAEDVDDFLLQVASEIDMLAAERDNAVAERNAAVVERDSALADLAASNERYSQQQSEELAVAVAARQDAEAKMYILAEKVEEYRGQEENLKNALINAQRMGETVIHEAKQKAEQMLREATGQSELITQRAEREVIKERAVLENIQGESKHFRSTILSLYKQHIESLSALDPPIVRAQEALDDTIKYREDVAVPVEEEMEEKEAPVAMGSAEPRLPTVDATPAYEPIGSSQTITAAEYVMATDEPAAGSDPMFEPVTAGEATPMN